MLSTNMMMVIYEAMIRLYWATAAQKQQQRVYILD